MSGHEDDVGMWMWGTLVDRRSQGLLSGYEGAWWSLTRQQLMWLGCHSA